MTIDIELYDEQSLLSQQYQIILSATKFEEAEVFEEKEIESELLELNQEE